MLTGGSSDQQQGQQEQGGILDNITGGADDTTGLDGGITEQTTTEKPNPNSEEDEAKKKYQEHISDDRDGFILHQGDIIETHTYDTIFNTSWNSDYEGMSSDGSISIPFHKEDLQYIYKGVRCLLKTKRFDNFDDTVEIDDEDGYLCFITDVNISDNKLELSLSGYEKLLEQENVLSFTNQRRSTILEEVIKMAGLVPVIDTTGLADEIISWSTEKETDKDSSNSGGSYGVSGDGSWTEEQLAQFKPQIVYAHKGRGHDPKKGYDIVSKQKKGDCYDVTAFAYYVYNFKIGIPCRDIVGKGSGASGTHHVAMIQKNGDWVFPDWYENVTRDLGITRGMKNGDYKVSREPPSGDGTIPEYRNDWYGNRS